ncbi:MAG: PASTA domain-containing protein [Endomicrobia bacterium]|nr:PASTA domain-containing protein [Endomicrobiia bacterium]MCX7715856.1 PASTA domain-containing protein [Endomicrobiia bacterium]
MPEEKVKQVPKGVSILIVILISIIISFLTCFFSYFYIFPSMEEKTLYVRVPDIRNISVSEATKKLEQQNLKIQVIEEIETDAVPVGCVVVQQPLPKTKVKKNTEVVVILSKGVPLVKIPDVKLKSVDEARKILLNVGLGINEIKEVETETVEKGLVVTTEPEEGVGVKKGSLVRLVVSKGKPHPVVVKKEVKKVRVPDIKNKSLVDAQKILEEQKLRLGNVKKICDEDKDFDIVVSQNPPAGTLVPEGSKIDIIYNTEGE